MGQYNNQNTGGNNIHVSGSNTHGIIDVTNNKSRYYAELAETYKNEAKSYRDSAMQYAMQNSNVTMNYVNNLESTLRNLIDEKQDTGNYALTEDIPVNVSDLSNDSGFISGIISSDVTTALGYIPANSANLASVATSGNYYDLINRPVHHNIGEIVTSTIPLTDAGLHLLDGALIQGSGSYGAFVDYIADLVTDYPDLFCTEAQWQQSVTDYGVCGKFVYDSTNNTVRLPKITGIIEGTTDATALGDLVEAGLPNIEGELKTFVDLGRDEGTGAIRRVDDGSKYQGTNTGSGTKYDGFDFDASRSSSIYGNSTTVQPQTIKTLYYIVIATSTQTQIQVDIDEIATDLNGKADVDLTNCTDVADIKMAHNAMPSDTYVDLTLGASDSQYVMPADGWLVINKHSTGTNQYAKLLNQSNGLVIETRGPANNTLCACYIPVKKGDTIVVGYSAGGTLECFRFIYAKGSESEAQ